MRRNPDRLPRGLEIDGDEESRFRPISLPLIRRLFGLLRPYRRFYLLGAAFGLTAVALELATPSIAQHIIDTSIPSRDPWGIASWAAAWAAIMALALLCDSWQIASTHGGGERMLSALRGAILEKLQRLPMAFYDRTKLGRIITRGTSDIDSIRPAIISGINTVIVNALMMVGAGFMIGYNDERMLCVLAILLPFLACTNRLYRRILAYQHQVVRAGYTRVASNLAENITGVRVVAAFNRQDENLERFNELQAINTENNIRVANTNGIYQPLLEFLRFAGQAVVLAYGGARILSGTMTAGTVIAILFYWDFFMRPTITIGNFYNTLMQAMASGERIFALLDHEEVREAPGAGELPRVDGHVAFERVSFAYEPGRPVIHDFALDIPTGSTVALVGATGSGKSTILMLLARFYEIAEGRILLDGADIRAATARSLRTQIGIVLQANFLFGGTVLENIRYPRPDLPEEVVYAAARALGVHDVFSGLEKGYATEVGERGSGVSLGLRQLICFTRVFVMDPRIFLLDEATSSIDTMTELKVQRALARLAAGRTTIVVAHRLSTIVGADRIVVMDHGRIVEQGVHGDLVRAGGPYAALYERFTGAERGGGDAGAGGNGDGARPRRAGRASPVA